MRQEWNGLEFYQAFDVFEPSLKDELIADLDDEIEENLGPVPLYQTKHDFHTHERAQHPRWQHVYSTVQNLVEEFYGKKVELQKSWANKITPDSYYFLHTHSFDIAVTYYLQTHKSTYGTYFNYDGKEIIFLGHENSVMAFDGKIPHEIVYPPSNVLKYKPRYSVAFDYNYVDT